MNTRVLFIFVDHRQLGNYRTIGCDWCSLRHRTRRTNQSTYTYEYNTKEYYIDLLISNFKSYNTRKYRLIYFNYPEL